MGMRGRRSGWAVMVALVVATSSGLVTAAPVGAQPAPPVPGTLGPRQAQPEDRYALVGGCYAIRSEAADQWVRVEGDAISASAPDAGSATGFRFQATDLGRYLLWAPDSRLLAGDGVAIELIAAPGPSADWQVDELGPGRFGMVLPASDRSLTGAADGSLALASGSPSALSFQVTEGCSEIQEPEIGVSGPHITGATPYEEVTGFFDAHLHLTAYEFLGGEVHCGQPWHPYGAPAALVDCPDHSIADGAGAVLENLLSGGDPLATHDTVGWPTFVDWPAPASLTHEQTYYRWVERTWRAGERMIVNLLVENRVLCEIYPLKRNPCDEMESVRLQAKRMHELERYIDAQSGGPGEGWFRIVNDPFEARRIINEGRLAIVLGIEISEPFGCISTVGIPQCSEADIDAQLDELAELGVHQITPIHKFDNALGGVAFDGALKGNVINVGNFYGTGRFWAMETCDPDDTGVHDNNQSIAPELDQVTSLFGGILTMLAPGTLPVYPPPNHCNIHGLTDLGEHALKAMIDRGIIVDIDHMSVRARQKALSVLEEHAYPGVISSHSWATPDAYPRVYELGGMTAPYAGGSTGFAATWEERRALADERYYFGLGFGADSNGLGAQGGPRSDASANPVRYPFEGLGGVMVEQQVSGQRTYDINVDGVAHYGLYPDWIADLQVLAGDAIVTDLARGSEAYLQVWERAIGIAGPRCPTAADMATLTAGMTVEEVLRAIGQPDRREGLRFTYCDDGSIVVDFDGEGRLLRWTVPESTPDAPAPPVQTGRLPATGGAPGAGLTLALLLGALAWAVRRASRPAQ